ncbi:hypothetical protein EMIHUDRAFT_221179 [Emiliania huxleyi CCMP1516]|uniref:RING-type domain-containing protein n=2 Tax=Emiliania huxleyi TaxID=2903 RepID=A0A0D3HZE5_EMIH1|nr:hypothetical protein EMIHUDRAFT_221179 [Emiliania huxleyi CCMP1516]EOD04380.1 hypothetical protein EMIHUDRAFT_221179 [Emiliania huxleyi CCMP1516]|eukprot:XP_005756809.1 hypothetical protein EMIHUDRAFT_221179 [Emiliania huxleyi CCMP1516]
MLGTGKRARSDAAEADASSTDNSVTRKHENGDSCTVCMSRPRTVRNQPCGHATLCELCTIKIIDPRSQSCQCPLCRREVTSLKFLPSTNAGVVRAARMDTYEAAADDSALQASTAEPEPTDEAGAQAFATLLEFLQAMLGSDSEDDSAFEGCSALTAVTLPDSLTSIGDYLTAVTLPDRYTSSSIEHLDWLRRLLGLPSLSLFGRNSEAM